MYLVPGDYLMSPALFNVQGNMSMLQSLTPIYSLYFFKPHLELSEEMGKFRLLFLARSSVKIALLSVKCLYFAKPFSVQPIAWLLIL